MAKQLENKTVSPVEFQENMIYTTEQASAILQRHPKTVRFLCNRGDLVARKDRSGYLITGWAIRAYAEGRQLVKTE